ncbi:hypothetical protein Psuf_072440 [Phytohabitans suffuscus]|uniref:Clp R domain-containing protein n=1 Tax=Phytohabitans suffuscus TaxID=624315 RepID=A0A6F8YVQ1_9ACTN|nr:hypothetical protein [Phytohabitans suffuscus]BCB89931.1 hypothetical protein Psuf_072440 [Phytohabitans suffuscus]
MPKINVYLPDALADRVRDARLPVSRICQVALTRALDGADSAAHEEPADLTLPEPIDLTPPPNHHVAAILRQSYDSAAARGSAAVETIDILQAFLDEGRASCSTPSSCWGSRSPRSRRRSTPRHRRRPPPPARPDP